jgi:electron transport complex protein RnfC
MKLVPTTIEKFVEADQIDNAVGIGLLDCIECGSCAYVCPSKRRLVHNFKFGKYIANERKKAAAAEGAGE